MNAITEWLGKIQSWISKALSETNGSPSSLRPAFWYHEVLIGASFVMLTIAVILFAWFKKDFNAVAIGGVILSWFTVNRGSKQLQKTTEDPTINT